MPNYILPIHCQVCVCVCDFAFAFPPCLLLLLCKWRRREEASFITFWAIIYYHFIIIAWWSAVAWCSLWACRPVLSTQHQQQLNGQQRTHLHLVWRRYQTHTHTHHFCYAVLTRIFGNFLPISCQVLTYAIQHTSCFPNEFLLLFFAVQTRASLLCFPKQLFSTVNIDLATTTVVFSAFLEAEILKVGG